LRNLALDCGIIPHRLQELGNELLFVRVTIPFGSSEKALNSPHSGKTIRVRGTQQHSDLLEGLLTIRGVHVVANGLTSRCGLLRGLGSRLLGFCFGFGIRCHGLGIRSRGIIARRTVRISILATRRHTFAGVIILYLTRAGIDDNAVVIEQELCQRPHRICGADRFRVTEIVITELGGDVHDVEFAFCGFRSDKRLCSQPSTFGTPLCDMCDIVERTFGQRSAC